MDTFADHVARIVTRVEAAGTRAVVVTGPARCGKTAVALKLYRARLDDAGCPRCLLLAPNAVAVSDLKRLLLHASPTGVVISPAVMTPAALGGRILAAAEDTGRVIPPLHRHLLLRRIVRELDEAGELAALGPVADTPGLPRELDRAIAELKRAAVEPGQLAAAVGRGTPRSRDLLAVYRRYQEALVGENLYDLEGQMWKALELLDTKPAQAARALGGARILVADGFTDFTPTQLDILVRLAGRLERVVITLCRGSDGRERMWQWADRTLQHIRDRFDDQVTEITVEPPPPAPGDLSVVTDRVFDPDAEPVPAPAGLEILAAAGTEQEVASAARQVKKLLADGAPAGSIAVLARSLESVGPAVERIFAACGVPVRTRPCSLADEPAVRFLLRCASLGPTFASEDVLRVIRSSYFRPEALGTFDELAVAAAETIIREGNVLEGRESYARAGGRLAARAPDGEEEDDAEPPAPTGGPGPAAIRAGADLLQALFEVCETTPLADLPGALETPEAVRRLDDEETLARDARALEALGACLQAAPSATGLPPAELRRALGAVPSPPPRGEALVELLDVLDARAVRYRHVFLLAAGEGQFPRPFGEGPLIRERDRDRWAARGAPLPRRRDLTAREMLLFYLAVSRADETLRISYLQSDATGRAGAPGSFLTALAAPFGGLDALQHHAPAGQLVPPAGEIASPADAVNAAVAGLFDETLDPDGAAWGWARAHAPDRLRAAGRGLWAHRRRWRPGECDAYDGRLSDADLLDALSERYPDHVVFSASQLDLYQRCPWQYFASYVLHLEPVARPERQLEPVSAGIFCHDVLFDVYRRLAEARSGSVRLPDVPAEELQAALDEAVQAKSDRVEARRPPYPALWEVQRRRMHEQLRAYLLAQRDETRLDTESLRFELAFGLDRQDDSPEDPASTPEPVAVETPAGTIRLRGRIDRVDRVRLEGAEGLLAVDYKTGRLPSVKDIEQGRHVQVPLYAEVLRRLLDGPVLGGALHHVGDGQTRPFGHIRRKKNGGYELAEDTDAWREQILQAVGRNVLQMAAGRFDAMPTHDCPGWCPYRQICQFSPARQEVKSVGEHTTEPGGAS